MVGAGNDLTDDITPVEAALGWAVSKSRRDKCDFIGGEVTFCGNPSGLHSLPCCQVLQMRCLDTTKETTGCII